MREASGDPFDSTLQADVKLLMIIFGMGSFIHLIVVALSQYISILVMKISYQYYCQLVALSQNKEINKTLACLVCDKSRLLLVYQWIFILPTIMVSNNVDEDLIL